ncbi:MAG: hypothetical protein COY66_01300 [Candidatus Kerfeldbacteria bacterium CG_4_10_14_0_8_um_filter_42_10]|uniref:EamA domain-containing protein n=1 Tax=Candidatus Kerfeldbacteria bacterium CG_4_10_14_0_8_um_filter_42_10 TaxID=2014248 RepID=A0A2M7RK70_9BACT|nr:MAG: hypothetical protein COY66_01300 [Candidatus Kerfeldbacteria bacterium CG_4_10_14_0_8_um_filter_42_10]
MIEKIKNIPNLQKGILLAFGAALVSGVANFVNKSGVTAVKDPFVYTTIKNLITAGLLLAVLLLFKNIKQLKALKKQDWLKLTVIGLIGGGIPFLLFFKGLSLTSAGSASFIHKTMFVWIALFALPFLKEKFHWYQYGALGILFLGNYILVGPKAWGWGAGESLILIATLFWAAEFIIAKRVLKKIHPNIVAWARMSIGLVFLLLFLFFTGRISVLAAVSVAGWGWSLLTGSILLLFVLSWYHALKRAPATLVTSVLVFASPITTLLDELFRKQQLLFNSAIGSLIIIIGIAIFSLALVSDTRKKELVVNSY